MLTMAVAVIPDHKVMCNVLPVLWMTLCLPTMGRTARGVDNDDVGALLKQLVNISNVFARCATLFDFVVVYNISKWRTAANCLRLSCFEKQSNYHGSRLSV